MKSPFEEFEEISCAVCKKCFFDKKRGACIYGGPYSGYISVRYEQTDAAVSAIRKVNNEEDNF